MNLNARRELHIRVLLADTMAGKFVVAGM